MAATVLCFGSEVSLPQAVSRIAIPIPAASKRTVRTALAGNPFLLGKFMVAA
jgi:hypothetical protein